MSYKNFCTATLLGCPAPLLRVSFHLEQQLLGVDVIDQAGVVLVHHGQLAAGRAHVQAAHGCGLLQQHDGQSIVHKDLQDLGTNKVTAHISVPSTANSTVGENFSAEV